LKTESKTTLESVYQTIFRVWNCVGPTLYYRLLTF